MKTPVLFVGKRVLEEVESKINGKITVVRSVGLGTYFQVGDLTQSGGVVHSVWKTALRKVKKRKNKVKNSLILGIGGGSAASLIRHFWSEASIQGVDIDPVMVELGKKYLGLDLDSVKIKDAEDFLIKSNETYDLILVDTYLGDQYPEKFATKSYIELVKDRLGDGGMAVFNRLYYGEKRKEAVKFGEKLEKNFSKVERVYPEANLMFLCFK